MGKIKLTTNYDKPTIYSDDYIYTVSDSAPIEYTTSGYLRTEIDPIIEEKIIEKEIIKEVPIEVIVEKEVKILNQDFINQTKENFNTMESRFVYDINNIHVKLDAFKTHNECLLKYEVKQLTDRITIKDEYIKDLKRDHSLLYTDYTKTKQLLTKVIIGLVILNIITLILGVIY